MNWIGFQKLCCIGLLLLVACDPAAGQVKLKSQAAEISKELTPENAARFSSLLEQDWDTPPEWAVMLNSILEGQPMGPDTGWFQPSQTRLGWTWLAEQFDRNGDQEISLAEAKRFAKVFDAIDRDANRIITAADFDWKDVSHVIPRKPSQALFLMMDRDSNGRVDREEILQWIARLDESREGTLTPDELSRGLAMLDQLARPAAAKSAPESDSKPDPPEQDPANTKRMLNMLFAGQLGTFTSGPEIGDVAPDFELPLLKDSGQIKLSSFRGDKIVVLNFGSFT